MKISDVEVNGVVRHLDNLGRIVIPMEIRKELNLVEGSKLEIFWSKKDKVILIKGCEEV